MKTSPDIQPRRRLAGLLPVLRSFAAVSLLALAPLAGGQINPSPAPDEGIPAANGPVPGANLAWAATARDGLTTTWEATETSTNFLTGEVTSTPIAIPKWARASIISIRLWDSMFHPRI